GGGAGGGFAGRAAEAAAVAAPGPGGDGGVVAAGAAGVSLGEAGGQGAGQRGAAARRGHSAPAIPDPERDASGGRSGPREGTAHAVAALRQGDQELLAWIVP